MSSSEVNNLGNDSFEVIDLCDASTVVNVSLFKKKNESDVEVQELDSNSEVSPQDTEVSLDNRLDSIDDTANQPSSDVENIEDCIESTVIEKPFELDEVVESFIAGDWKMEDELVPSYPTRNYRARVFLLEVEPKTETENDFLDLVSGYCLDGCRKFTVYSAMYWCQKNGFDIPMCPHCEGKELKLMFKFALYVLGRLGIHERIHLCKENAEKFLGYSAVDFINDRSVREAAIIPLIESSLLYTTYVKKTGWTPIYDINFVCIKARWLVVLRPKLDNGTRWCRNLGRGGPTSELETDTRVN